MGGKLRLFSLEMGRIELWIVVMYRERFANLINIGRIRLTRKPQTRHDINTCLSSTGVRTGVSRCFLASTYKYFIKQIRQNPKASGRKSRSGGRRQTDNSNSPYQQTSAGIPRAWSVHNNSSFKFLSITYLGKAIAPSSQDYRSHSSRRVFEAADKMHPRHSACRTL